MLQWLGCGRWERIAAAPVINAAPVPPQARWYSSIIVGDRVEHAPGASGVKAELCKHAANICRLRFDAGCSLHAHACCLSLSERGRCCYCPSAAACALQKGSHSLLCVLRCCCTRSQVLASYLTHNDAMHKVYTACHGQPRLPCSTPVNLEPGLVPAQRARSPAACDLDQGHTQSHARWRLMKAERMAARCYPSQPSRSSKAPLR
jgi:hypothetical protein